MFDPANEGLQKTTRLGNINMENQAYANYLIIIVL